MSTTFLPASIYLFDGTCTIHEQPDFANNDHYGEFKCRERKIIVNQDLPQELMLRTLWHEAFHAMQEDLHDADTSLEDEAKRGALLVNSVLLANPELVKRYAEYHGLIEAK